MAIFKCKMCGGDLEIAAGATIAQCDYCGTKQTVPKVSDENLQNLFNRANTLRIKSEFDKAEKLYEKIVQADSTQADAYWGLILCRYGIEYVDDPATFQKIPTCHRASYDSVIADEDYKAAIEHADGAQREVYEQQAREIDRIQKEILALAQKEEAYDVFICYKETDSSGSRTQDSVIANDIYYQLTQEGFKVFYAAITLEGKLGSAYEPIIFAALNSAKVMLTIGTRPEYFNAVWVKNEWSRFLKIIQKDRSKLLIPCYRDMDAYELPEEFAHLQAQDMSKIGFINDVVRGIKKVIRKDEPKQEVVQETAAAANVSIAPLLKRAFMFLEDGEWDRADDFCEQVLNIDPECAQAYLGKLMAQLRVRKQEELKGCAEPFDNSSSYKKAVRFADTDLKEALAGYITHIRTRNENARLENLYQTASRKMSAAATEAAFKEASMAFAMVLGYKDADALAEQCLEKAEGARKDWVIKQAKAFISDKFVGKNEEAIKLLKTVSGWKDADELIAACEKKIAEIRAKEEADRLEQERQAAQRAKRNKKITLISAGAVAVVAAVLVLWFTWIIPSMDYSAAMELKEKGELQKAATAFSELGDFRDAKNQASTILEKLFVRTTISAGSYHTVGLKADGTAVATGDNDYGQRNVSGWKDIVAISAGGRHTVGLKADGTVVAIGYNGFGQCDVSGWKDIVAISAGDEHTVGLKADGTVVATGDNSDGECDVSGWKNIVAISAGYEHTIGLKANGTVVATGDNTYGQCNVSGWKDIVAISAGLFHTVGLKANGTVVATGDNSDGQCKVSGWENIRIPAID